MLIAAALTNFMAVLSCEGSGISEHESAYITTSLRNAATSASNGEYKVMDSETIAEVIGPERQKCFMGKCTFAIARELQAQYGVSCSIAKVGKDILTSIEVYSSSGDYIIGYQPPTGDIISLAKEITGKFPTILSAKIKQYVSKPEAKPEVKSEAIAEKKPVSNPLTYYCGRTFKNYILDKKIIPTRTYYSKTPFFEIEIRKQPYGVFDNTFVSGRSALKFKKDNGKEEIFYGSNVDMYTGYIKNGEYDVDLNDTIMGHTIRKIVSGTVTVCDIDSEEYRKAVAEKAAAERAAAERAAAEKAAAEKAAEEAAAAQRVLAFQRALDERIAQREAAERAAQREAEERAAAAERLARKDADNIYGGWCGYTAESFIKSWGRRPDYVGVGSSFYRYDGSDYNVELNMDLRGNISGIYLRSKPNNKAFSIKACSYP